jgi:hypothetical protein
MLKGILAKLTGNSDGRFCRGRENRVASKAEPRKRLGT